MSDHLIYISKDEYDRIFGEKTVKVVLDKVAAVSLETPLALGPGEEDVSCCVPVTDLDHPNGLNISVDIIDKI